jgi:hypothetical protein
VAVASSWFNDRFGVAVMSGMGRGADGSVNEGKLAQVGQERSYMSKG